MSVPTGALRVAVIDRDPAFLQVLGKRLDAAGWQHRVLSGAVPAEELVSMKINALLVDLTVLPPDDAWSFLERVAGLMPGLGIVSSARTTPRSPSASAACASAPTTGSPSPVTPRR